MRVGANEWHYEFIRYALVVGLFHALNGINLLAAFRIREHHRVVSLRDSFPSAIAIHRVIAAIDGGDLAAAILTHLLLQFFEITSTIGGKRVAPVHKGMDEDALQRVLLRHP